MYITLMYCILLLQYFLAFHVELEFYKKCTFSVLLIQHYCSVQLQMLVIKTVISYFTLLYYFNTFLGSGPVRQTDIHMHTF